VVTSNSADVLNELLDAELIYDATTTRGLTNHLPMALVAKVGLGAPPEELTRFADKYRQRLFLSPDASETLTRRTWIGAVGTPAAYPDLVRYFDNEVEEHGIADTLRTHLEDLVGGVSGAAFHGVIRLAYALDVESPQRVSTGLAYLAANAMYLAPLDEGVATTIDPAQLLRQLATARDWRDGANSATISEEMRSVASQSEFRGVAASLVVDDTSPGRLAEVALALYATTDNFTALHGVTGLEALSKLRPFVEDVERFDRATFQALAAAYLSIGAPTPWSDDQLEDFAHSTNLDESSVHTRASLSDDEHVSKIVFTAKRLKEVSGNPLYRAVAERAVRNDTSPQAQRTKC
jgi:hypothetical protein